MTGTDLIALLAGTSLAAKLVMGVLLVFSVVSWGIIISKFMLLRKVKDESAAFWRMFAKAQNLAEVRTSAESLRFTPLVAVLDSGYQAMQAGSAALASVQRSMQRSASAQLTVLENRMTFLATTAAVCPFIGLFGTVWGVLTSFASLANTNVATLRAVAPGIAEALITTAFGLLAAIPAVIAYNHLVTELKRIGGDLDDLQAELLTIAEKES